MKYGNHKGADELKGEILVYVTTCYATSDVTDETRHCCIVKLGCHREMAAKRNPTFANKLIWLYGPGVNRDAKVNGDMLIND